MVLRPLRRWFTPKDFVSNHTSRLLCQRGRFHRPQFERLEDRLAPATHTWTGATSGLWSVNSNWTGGSPATDPNAALVFPAGASNLANNNDLNFPTIISITYTGSGYLTTGNPVTFPSSGSPQTIAVAAGVAGVDTFNPGIIFGVGTVTANVTSAGATLTLGGKLSETAMSNLNITGAGTLVLTGNNTYTGGTNLAGGTLAVGSNTALGTGGLSLSGGTNIQATGGAISLNNTLSINGDITIGGTNNLTFTGATTLSAGVSGAPITLTATNTGLTTFGGQLSTNLSIFAPISVNTAGPGTVVIAGTGNYSVPTVVTAGTLLVNGALPTSDVMVNSGATFGGSGVVQTITANGTVSPGGPGTAILQTGTATFNAGSTLTVKLNGTAAGSGYDQLNGSSAIDLTGSPTLNVVPGFPAAVGNTFVIAASSGTLTGTFNGLPNNSIVTAGGQSFQVAYTANTVVLTRTLSPTTTTVLASAAPSVFGQPVTFMAMVTPTNPGPGLPPTGTVQFQIDGANFGSPVTLVNGAATSSATTLLVGTHTITAIYSGDPSFTGGTGTLIQIVRKANTTATVQSSVNPSVFGQSVTFTVTIAVTAPGAGTPTGTVQFQIDGNNAGSPVNVTTSGGVTTASFSTNALTVAMHTITANYSGDAHFAAS
ncbi:MAG TPA: Ig-like domain repeat protein, partial [Gemmataceae bacterium]|nr:Ig-like domain repeat protein [Gemmataceae bacterium]